MAGADNELADAWQAYHAADLPAAEAACRRLLEDRGDHVGAMFLASLIDCQRGQLPSAIERLQQTVKLRPNYAEAHNNLGNALACQGQLAKAEKSFREALRHKPQYAEALNNLGNCETKPSSKNPFTSMAERWNCGRTTQIATTMRALHLPGSSGIKRRSAIIGALWN
jgi:predicted Zn-dependent protease